MFIAVAAGPIKFAQGLAQGAEPKARFGVIHWTAAAALLGIALVTLLNSPSGWLALCGALGVAILLSMSWFTSRRLMWLFPALLAIEVIGELRFLPLEDQNHWMVRYPLFVIFCLPVLPRLLRSDVLWRGGYRLYSLYFAWAAVTLPFSLDPVSSTGRLLSAMLVFGALLVISLEINGKDDILAFFQQYFIWMAILVVAVATSPLYLGHDAVFMVESTGLPRFSGIFDTPNAVGQLMLATVTPALALWPQFSKRGKRPLSVLILTALVMGAVADSRTPLVAVACGAIAYLVWRYRARGLLAVVVGAMVVLALAAVVNPQYFVRGVGTLTGRTEVWRFAFRRLWERPLTGFGYAVEGQVLQSRYFTLWDDYYNAGTLFELHSEYLSRAVALGIPALALWLFLIVRPWVWVMLRKDDPWGLKPVALLVVVPLLIRFFAESEIGDCRFPAGALLVITWAIAERLRLQTLERERVRASAVRAGLTRPIESRLALGWSLP